MQSEQLSSITSPHSWLNDYTKTRDEDLGKEGKSADEVKYRLARQGTTDKVGFLCAWWKINQGPIDAGGW